MTHLKHFCMIIYIIFILFVSGCAAKNSAVTTSFSPTPNYPQNINPNESAHRMVNVMTRY